MGTISIHGLSPELEKVLKDKAKENHQSISCYIKDLIERSLSKKVKINKNRKHFAKFSNTWTETEFKEFGDATNDFEQINPEDWI